LFVTSAGVVIENNRTLPYGESWLPDVQSVNKKKFTTYERDPESGLDYAVNRYYSNLKGSFMSVDKGPAYVREPRSLNRYTYVNLDPINNTDSTGSRCGDPGSNCYAGPDPEPPFPPGGGLMPTEKPLTPGEPPVTPVGVEAGPPRDLCDRRDAT